MLNSNHFLKLCEELKHQGCIFPVKAGVRLGRGFADLGYEEFYLLNNQKIVSIFTGTLSDWNPLDEKFFFVVPTEKDLFAKLIEKGIEIMTCQYVNEQEWCLEVVFNQEKREFRGSCLAEVLMAIFIKHPPVS